jgi:hypothetical protein
MYFASARWLGSASDSKSAVRNCQLRLVKSQDSPMSDRKLRLVAQNSMLAPQLKEDAFGQLDCAELPRGPASAEENLRLLKAFSVIGDNRRRAWLVELVEHFAGLENVTR